MQGEQDVLQQVLGTVPVAAEQVGEAEQFQAVAVGQLGHRAAGLYRHRDHVLCDAVEGGKCCTFWRLNSVTVNSQARRVALVTLGCARNEVDSEELAARLGAGDWALSDEADADVLVVNTCGFVDAAKKDSIDTVLAAADTGKKVVAVGCLAERYGDELAAQLPEADAVLGFDSYADIAARLDDVAAGRAITPHKPRDRRTLLPVTPVHRPAAAADVALPGTRLAADRHCAQPGWTTRRWPT